MAPRRRAVCKGNFHGQAAELAYLTLASQVIAAVRRSDGVTGRELFERFCS